MQHGGDRSPPYASTRSPAIPLADIVTANENWRGKNDPAERRRIQNRLNQRAFRQRQRAGESPKLYKARRPSAGSSSEPPADSEDDVDSVHSECGEEEQLQGLEARVAANPMGSPPTSRAGPQEGSYWDELGGLINRNFIQAVRNNAQHLGIDPQALQSGSAIRTPRSSPMSVPATLTPVELQHQIPHDPIIDTLPHARLRFNILRGIATGILEAAELCRSLRASGALEACQHPLPSGSHPPQQSGWQRSGLVVWSATEEAPDMRSWELSEPFVRRWGSLLSGCEDLIAATNAWRARRGERLFPASMG